MAYGSIPLEKRLRENIKSYKLENLYDLEKVQKLFRDLGEAFGMELLLTQRHGETAVAVGDFSDFEPDVETEPGRKIRVAERTLGSAGRGCGIAAAGPVQRGQASMK